MKKKGEPNAFAQVEENTSGDVFENAIRTFGVVNACEWFGHRSDSEFTKETIALFVDRAVKRHPNGSV